MLLSFGITVLNSTSVAVAGFDSAASFVGYAIGFYLVHLDSTVRLLYNAVECVKALQMCSRECGYMVEQVSTFFDNPEWCLVKLLNYEKVDV